MRYLLFGLLLLFLGCTPYTKQIRALDSAYKAGQIRPADYVALRSQLAYADDQYRQMQAAQVARGLAAAGASIQQNYQNQQWLNAYNTRTMAMSMPQQVNVNYSGTINHNVDGTLYWREY